LAQVIVVQALVIARTPTTLANTSLQSMMLRGLLCLVFCVSTQPAAGGWLDGLESEAKGLMNSAVNSAQDKACDKAIEEEMGQVTEMLGDTVKEHCDSIKSDVKEVNTCCTHKGEELKGKVIGGQKSNQKEKCMKIKKMSKIPTEMKSAIVASKGQAKTDLKKGFKDLDACKEDGKELAHDVEDKITGEFELAPLSTSNGVSFAGVVALTGASASTVLVGAIIMRWRRGVPTVDEESMVETPLSTPE